MTAIKPYLITFYLLTLLGLSGCVAVIDATTTGPIQIDPSKRSLGEYVDDGRLKTIVAVNLKKAHPQLDKAHINVYSYNSVILLTGEVPSNEMRELAGKTARDVNRIRQVYNELTIGPKTTFLSRTNDNWIHSRIKTKLLFNSDINSKRVKIIVEDNIVYLMGLLTKVQTDKITEVVRRTRGVKKVVRAIEYID
ncbi:BON domain-containing protein [Agarilytica rhodophyticola]|uniref:BON domain-containing protein n=1 Tax=Agarilytica rhodophyticola TaxID=1737490 RepID=UPI000B344C53|nr:BON domain-containing protein [Agarilytica rhodophyticola]